MITDPSGEGLARALGVTIRQGARCQDIACFLALIGVLAGCQRSGPGLNTNTGLVRVSLYQQPMLAALDSEDVLVYELHFTSDSSTVPIIERIEVLSDDTPQRTLAVLRDSSLASALEGVGDTADFLSLSDGPRVVAYMWVPIDGSEPPEAIRHIVQIIDERGISHRVDAAPTPVRIGHPSISPPLRGTNWLAGNGPSNTSDHRRYLFANSSRIILWERFAIDFQRVDSAGRSVRNGGLRNTDYYSYDQPVFAVADGTVVEVRSDLPENVPNEPPVVTPDFDTVSGNHVTIDIGQGRFVLYAHLRPGSIMVKAGDQVQRGRLLGRIGNSGLSSSPHLHFQVADSPGIYAAEGLPFAFERYEVIGHCDDTTCSRLPAVLQRGVLPRDGQLLRFSR